ncbi:hypothetical protein [Lacticaseibacillus nasuensis]|uniref:hypothetical protein n=1 Tax=Lacticaseibacillus nasuensis TaxID=944671 RepID=UPI0006CF5C40|nr:hypothetical protein [Lacticaseibacillus nasuensis]
MKDFGYFNQIAILIRKEFPQLGCWALPSWHVEGFSITLDYYISQDAHATVTLYWGAMSQINRK